MASSGFVFLTLAPQVHAQAILKDQDAMPGMTTAEITAAQAEAFRRASSSSITSSGTSDTSDAASPLKRFLKLNPGSKFGDWTVVVDDDGSV